LTSPELDISFAFFLFFFPVAANTVLLRHKKYLNRETLSLSLTLSRQEATTPCKRSNVCDPVANHTLIFHKEICLGGFTKSTHQLKSIQKEGNMAILRNVTLVWLLPSEDYFGIAPLSLSLSLSVLVQPFVYK
jgi:hypothetical protein